MSPSQETPLSDSLKPFVLLGGFNAAELWGTVNLCMLCWLLFIFAPRWKYTPAVSLIPPIFHSVIYVGAIFSLILTDDGEGEMADMATLEGVVKLFRDPNGVFVGWIHYVAFDALVGRMIVMDSVDSGASTLFHASVIVPCLLFTFLLGPTGFLMYMVAKVLFLSGGGKGSKESSSVETPLKAKVF